MSCRCTFPITHIWMSPVTHMNESCHTRELVLSRVYEWAMSRTGISMYFIGLQRNFAKLAFWSCRNLLSGRQSVFSQKHGSVLRFVCVHGSCKISKKEIFFEECGPKLFLTCHMVFMCALWVCVWCVCVYNSLWMQKRVLPSCNEPPGRWEIFKICV